MPSSASRVTLRVAGDQLGIVEIVARIHAHALRQAAPHLDLLLLVEQRNLYAIDFGGVAAMTPTATSMPDRGRPLPQ